MEKNVEFTVSGIKCDNPSCDYKDMGVKFEDYPDYINKPCPKCGSVLLTQEDHDKCLMFQQIADTINAIPVSRCPPCFSAGDPIPYHLFSP